MFIMIVAFVLNRSSRLIPGLPFDENEKQTLYEECLVITSDGKGLPAGMTTTSTSFKAAAS